jgi:hypothetical protein
MREINDQNLEQLRRQNPVKDESAASLAQSAAFAELFSQIVSEPVAAYDRPIGDQSVEIERVPAVGSTYVRRVQRRLVLGGVTVAVLVTVLFVGQSLGWLGKPDSSNSSGRVGTASWRLVSDVTPAWHIAAGAVLSPNFQLLCPTATTCYAYAPPLFSSLGGAGAMRVTHDGGATWQELALPTTFEPSPTMSCIGEETCAIVGVAQSGGSIFLESTDGGNTWSTQSGPSQLTDASQTLDMSCASATTCLVISPEPEGLAFATSNGGASWTEGALPTGFLPNPNLDCFSVTACVVGGLSSSWPSNPNPDDFNEGLVYYTTNDATSWTQATTPTGFGEVSSISCVASGQCLATSDQGNSTGAEYVSSTDGGATWSQVDTSGFSNDFGIGLSCPTASTCWADGASATPVPDTQPGSVAGEDQLTDVTGLVAYTTDGGQSWQSAVLPANVQDVFGISCPNTTTCFALAIDTSTTPGTLGTPYLLTNGS